LPFKAEHQLEAITVGITALTSDARYSTAAYAVSATTVRIRIVIGRTSAAYGVFDCIPFIALPHIVACNGNFRGIKSKE